MKIIIKAMNQRRYFKTTYKNDCFEENCTKEQKILQALGDFYIRQTTYTKLVYIEIIHDDGTTTTYCPKTSKRG